MINILAKSSCSNILAFDFKILLKFGMKKSVKICENDWRDIDKICLKLYLQSLWLFRRDRKNKVLDEMEMHNYRIVLE